MSRSHCSEVALSKAPALTTSPTDTPWMPMAEGQAVRLLRVLPERAGYVAQLRLEPGTAIPPHRHTGPVHAFNLKGQRRIHSGEVVGVGVYVYEPQDHIDSWEAIGDEPLIVHIQVEGDVEYLDDQGEVASTHNAHSLLEAYKRYCEANSLPIVDLGG